MKQVVPWLTSAMTLWGIYEQGRKRSRGWLIGLANQVLWITFIVTFGAWGLLPLSAALVVMYTRNLLAWRRDERGDRDGDREGECVRDRDHGHREETSEVVL